MCLSVDVRSHNDIGAWDIIMRTGYGLACRLTSLKGRFILVRFFVVASLCMYDMSTGYGLACRLTSLKGRFISVGFFVVASVCIYDM